MEPQTTAERPPGTARRVLRILLGVIAVVVGAAVTLVLTCYAMFFTGWFALLVPAAVLTPLVRALSRPKPERCPQCGTVLSPAAIHAVPVSDGGFRLRADYRCTVAGHRSWRWVHTGEPLQLANR